VNEELPVGHECAPDHLERRKLIVEVVHGVEEDRGGESIRPRHLAHRQRVELAFRQQPLADITERRDARPRNLDHLRRDVDSVTR
jgi:hypothetical protein